MSPTTAAQEPQSTEDSITIKVEEGEESDQETGNKAISIEDDEDDIDPRDVWRLGYPYQEYQLFMRPATISNFCFFNEFWVSHGMVVIYVTT